MNFRVMLFATAASAISLVAGTAGAVTLNFDSTSQSSNSPATGASASAAFSFSDVMGDVLVSILITNTTGSVPSFGSGATTSMLTGIGFDLAAPATYVAGSFAPGANLDTFTQLAAPGEDTTLNPFGSFDIGILDNTNFEGGNANDALPEGQSNTVSFKLDTTLTAGAYEALFATGFASGDLRAVARFQQVNAGEGSDKLLYNPPETPPAIPLPAAGWLLLAGVGGLAALRRSKKAA